MERVYLTIETLSRRMPIIQIPFLKLKYLDEFTTGFNGKAELTSVLFSLLDMPVSKYEIDSLYISYAKDETKELRQLPIKYSLDDYDVDDLKKVYTKFFDDDHTRVGYKKYGLVFVGHEAIWLAINGVRDIAFEEIKKAVDAYMSRGYMNKRNAYFILKENRYNVKTRQEVENKKISQHGNADSRITDRLLAMKPQNDYFVHLRDYALRGEEEYAKAMEILAGYDLEELHKNMAFASGGIVDGVMGVENADDNKLDIDKLFLTSSTGYSIYELNQIINSGGYTRNSNDGRSLRR